MFNPLDLHAAPDVSDAEESAYEKAVDRIARMDGRALFESGNFTMDDTDGMFDMYDLPRVFDASLVGATWDELAPDEHHRWNMLASVLRDFAHDRLDEGLCMEHANDI